MSDIETTKNQDGALEKYLAIGSNFLRKKSIILDLSTYERNFLKKNPENTIAKNATILAQHFLTDETIQERFK